jgi:hypothetical protein
MAGTCANDPHDKSQAAHSQRERDDPAFVVIAFRSCRLSKPFGWRTSPKAGRLAQIFDDPQGIPDQ